MSLLTLVGHAGDIWVSPRGNDQNDGTRQSPKATLTSALRQAREWRRTGDNRVLGGITVYMEGGVYSLYEPVFIRPEDSGTKGSPTVIRSVRGEDAVLSGGVSIRNWKNKENYGWRMYRCSMAVRWISANCGWMDRRPHVPVMWRTLRICIAFAVLTRRLKLFMCLPPPFARLRMGKAR